MPQLRSASTATATTESPVTIAASASPAAKARQSMPSSGALLEWLGQRGRGGNLLLACWASLLVLATQIPQHAGPLWTDDGLVRGDLVLFEALGLDRLGLSAPAWLMVAVTAVVMIATIWRAPRPLDPDPATDAAVLRALGPAWTRRPVRRQGALLVVGRQKPALVLFSLSAVALFAAWTAAALAPNAVELHVRAGSGTGGYAERLDVGRRVLFAGPERRCTSAAAGLICREGPPAAVAPTADAAAQDVDAVRLDVGAPAVANTTSWTWTGRSNSAAVGDGRFEWRTDAGDWVGFDVAADRATLVPSLSARVSTVATQRSGPIASVVEARNAAAATPDRPQFSLLASPALIDGVAKGRLRASAIDRIRIESVLPHWLALLALALLLAAIAAGLASPLALLEVTPGVQPGAVRVVAANRSVAANTSATATLAVPPSDGGPL